MSAIIINTKRLDIRKCQPSDLTQIIQIIQESKFWNLFGFEDEPTTVNLNNRMKELFQEEGWFVYSIKNTKDIIGWVFLGKTWMNTQISYYISSHHYRKGYTIEATKDILDYFLKNNTNKELEHICGYVRKENKGSKRIMEKLGFEFRGEFEYDLYHLKI